MNREDIRRVSRALLQPYRIPAGSPYLSEEQRELSLLDQAGRSAWMAEWLHLAQAAEDELGRPNDDEEWPR